MIREIVSFIRLPITELQVQAIRQDAFDIIDAAAKVDLEFRLSKAYYTAFFFNTTPPYHPQFFGYAFDATRMEQTSTGPKILQSQEAHHHLVDLAISPGLVKAGNADGTNYHAARVLVKMEVCCNIRYFIGGFQDDNNIEDGHEDVSTLPDGSAPVKAESQTNLSSSPATDVERDGNTGRVTYTIPDSSPIKAERFQQLDELFLAPLPYSTAVKTGHSGGNHNVQKVTAHGDGEDELAHTYNVMLPGSPAVKFEGGVNRVVSDQMLTRADAGGDIEMHDASSQSKPGWPKDAR
ncbi:hypothetical protein N0V85_005399 [Neurospora sp. IMI 360204]|nr:hypothetical protein N0V85_005399 [Neurospora sp. IMI 360204]